MLGAFKCDVTTALLGVDMHGNKFIDKNSYFFLHPTHVDQIRCDIFC